MNQDNCFVLVVWVLTLLIGAPSVALYSCAPQPTKTGVDNPYGEVAPYDRSSWGRWTDDDNDCQDTRQEVLVRQSEIPVTLDDKGCKVLTGKWTCPYTGHVFTDPSELDIDHMVPLKEAYDSGAATWSEEEKNRYLNFLGEGHLLAVDASANRSKGARKPTEWLPPNRTFRCEYLKDWLKVKHQWNLGFECDEAQELSRLVGGCF